MSAQLALFAVSPSLTDLSEHGNHHDAYQRFLMAERDGDAALLAWVKIWGRPAMVALIEARDGGFESAEADDERRAEIEEAVSEAEKAQAAVAEDAANDVNDCIEEMSQALKALKSAASKLKSICPEGAAA